MSGLEIIGVDDDDEFLLNFVVVSPPPPTSERRPTASEILAARLLIRAQTPSSALLSRMLSHGGAPPPQELTQRITRFEHRVAHQQLTADETAAASSIVPRVLSRAGVPLQSPATTRLIRRVAQSARRLTAGGSRAMTTCVWLMQAGPRNVIAGMFTMYHSGETGDSLEVEASALFRAYTRAVDIEAQRRRAVRRPPPSRCVDTLEKVKIEESAESAAVQSCAICLEELAVGSEAMRMPCMHVYHGPCITAWLQKNDSCPLCRFQLRSCI